MKPRHVAALTLVGWYLMVPADIGGLPAGGAPLSQWERIGNYASFKSCYAEKENRLRELNAESSTRPNIDVIWQQLNFGQCVQADDPRLKPK